MIPKKNTDVFYSEEHFIRSHYLTEIYVPDGYLENSKFNENGTTMIVLGILPYSVIQDGKVVYSGTLKIPQVISLNITRKRRDIVKLSKFSETPEHVTVLTYQPTEPITSVYTEANASMAADVFDMVLGGRLPPNIPYQEVLRDVTECFRINNVKIPIPSFLMEDIIATLYRSTKNPDNKFAYDLGKHPDMNPLNYQAMSAKNVTRHISTFAGMTSEQMGEALLYGVKRTKEGKTEPENPIEKTIYA